MAELISELERAAHEGREAFFDLKEFGHNPYPVRSREFYSWHDGFSTAKQDWRRRFGRKYLIPTN